MNVTASTLTLSLVALFSLTASACTGADSMGGTWTDSFATTRLPAHIGGGILNVDATLVLDADVAPATFELTLALETDGLADTIIVEGTYVDNGPDLTLTATGFVIDPASGNAANVAEDGSQCVLMQGFGGAGVCFPAPQTNDYVLVGDSLEITINQAIAGADANETFLSLTRTY
ncbi:MAG: hypothetical protein DRJ42_29080 [Deltaproteobacteria bacterium]|nr:MAG: hypothetical protein DRJ42_29080 [Deltaproteobacteria bacterium]